MTAELAQLDLNLDKFNSKHGLVVAGFNMDGKGSLANAATTKTRGLLTIRQSSPCEISYLRGAKIIDV